MASAFQRLDDLEQRMDRLREVLSKQVLSKPQADYIFKALAGIAKEDPSGSAGRPGRSAFPASPQDAASPHNVIDLPVASEAQSTPDVIVIDSDEESLPFPKALKCQRPNDSNLKPGRSGCCWSYPWTKPLVPQSPWNQQLLEGTMTCPAFHNTSWSVLITIVICD